MSCCYDTSLCFDPVRTFIVVVVMISLLIFHGFEPSLTGSPSGTHMGWMWARGQGPQGKTFISTILEFH